MEDYEYVMMIDENGSPYLAHVDWGKARQTVRNAASSAAGAVKSAGKKSYKYYQKLKEGGKTLYFYSADELKAHYDNLRRQASGAVNSVKNSARTAAAKASVAANELGNRAAYTAFKARQTANNMRNEFANRANQASNAIKDKAGVDERERMDAAKKAADEAQTRYDNAQDRLDEAHDLRADAKRNGGAGLSEAEELVRGAAREREAARKDNEAKQKAYRDAQAEYDATVLGKGDRAKEAANNAKGAVNSAGRAVKDAADNIKESVEYAAGGRYKEKADKYRAESDKYSKDADELSKAYNEAMQDLYKANNDFDNANTALTKATRNLENANPFNRKKLEYEYKKAKAGYLKAKLHLDAANRSTELIKHNLNQAQDNSRYYNDRSNANMIDYNNSLLGKAGQAKEAISNAASNARDAAGRAIDSAQESARKAVDASKSKFDRMKDDFAKKADQAKEAVGNATDKAKDLAGEKYKKEAEAWAEKAENSSKRMDEIVKNGYDDDAYRKERDLYFNYQNHRRAAENAYDNSLIGRAKSTVDSIKDATGVGQRERMKVAEKEESDALKKLEAAQDYFDEIADMRDDAKRNGGAGQSRAQELLDQAFDDYAAASLDWMEKSRAASRARWSYSGTPLNKIERAIKSASDAIDDAKNASQSTVDSARRAAVSAVKKAEQAINSARDTANNAVASAKDKAGVDERERRDAAKKAADEAQTRYDNAQDRLDEAHELRADAKRNGGAGLSRAEELVRGAAREREAARKDNEEKQKAYRDAQSDYDATVLGKGDRAKEAAGRAASEAVSGIREVWNKLSSGKALTKKDREILNEYNRKNR